MPSCSWWLYSYVKMRGDPKGARVGLNRVRRDWSLERHGLITTPGKKNKEKRRSVGDKSVCLFTCFARGCPGLRNSSESFASYNMVSAIGIPLLR